MEGVIHHLVGINWGDFLVPGVSVLEKIVRPLIVYFVLIIGLRVAGKRELAQLNPFDIIVLLTLSNTVQNAIIGNDNSVSGGILGAATLLTVNYLMVRLIYRSRKIDRILEGDPDVLIRDGRVMMDRLEEELITLQELTMAAHKQGIATLEDVESAVLDPDGVVLFVEKKPTIDSVRHREILERIDALAREVAALKGG
jgi:uncharacterized membrane protein YcaP (DUF421 family)